MGPDDRLLPEESRIIVRIDRRFRGPPDSGNGGYVAGLLARELGASNVEVTLRLPPPLDCDLSIENDGDTALLRGGGDVIATAVRREVTVGVPPPPPLSDAGRAQERYAGLRHHAYPGCFVCGPDRDTADGLCIFPGPLGDPHRQVAARWLPDASLLDPAGAVGPDFIWAALDCPGYWAVAAAAGIAVLGRFGVVMHETQIDPQPLIVTGWPIRSEDRKHEAGTALHDGQGRLLAAARATWITLQG